MIKNIFSHFPLPTDDGGKGIFSMVHIKSVEEYEDEEYHDYSDDDIFEATTFHPNSVLPADAMDKASLFKDLIIKLVKCSTRLGDCH